MLMTAVKSAIVVVLAAILATQVLVRLFPRGGAAPAPELRTVAAAPPKPAHPLPPPARAAGRGDYAIAADRLGQYAADVEINGGRIRMLVDTGASAVALAYEEAAAVGFYPTPTDFKYQVNTANGVARVARVRLREVRLGPLVVHDVDAFVGERGALTSSLLGMTFLGRLSHIEAGSGMLVLTQ